MIEFFNKEDLVTYYKKIKEINTEIAKIESRRIMEVQKVNQEYYDEWVKGYKKKTHLPISKLYTPMYQPIIFTLNGFAEWLAGGDEVLNKFRPITQEKETE